MSDVQHSWVLLSQAAVPRANHTLRTTPPSHSEEYAIEHDAVIWECFCNILGARELAGDALARQVARHPGRLGGFGLRVATRSAEAAYWSSWVDALHVISGKFENIATQILNQLRMEELSETSCLKAVEEIRRRPLSRG